MQTANYTCSPSCNLLLAKWLYFSWELWDLTPSVTPLNLSQLTPQRRSWRINSFCLMFNYTPIRSRQSSVSGGNEWTGAALLIWCSALRNQKIAKCESDNRLVRKIDVQIGVSDTDRNRSANEKAEMESLRFGKRICVDSQAFIFWLISPEILLRGCWVEKKVYEYDFKVLACLPGTFCTSAAEAVDIIISV